MNDKTIDIIGIILWWSIFISPLFVVVIVYKKLKIKKLYRLLVGIAISALISLMLYLISISIIFRDGMGS